MSWTKSGKVSLTNGSAAVYGAGTAWVSGGKARAGDVFMAPGGALYEVASVESNTQLTLSSAYLGSTTSGQAYALIHTGLLPSELATSLSDLQSKYLTTVSQLWEWETSNAATVPLTNPATGVTSNVKPIAGLVLDVDGKAPVASPSFSGTLTHSGNVVLTGSGKRITADFSNATIANRMLVQSSTANGVTNVELVPNGTSRSSAIIVSNTSGDAANTSFANLLINDTEVRVQSAIRGTGSYLPMTFYTGGAERLNLDTAGNFLARTGATGHGVGSGGTVTQATSKSTAVSLHKPNGVITMHAAQLNPSTTVTFVLNNSFIAAKDRVLAHKGAAGSNVGAYTVWVDFVAAGQCEICVRNNSASALSEAITINFEVRKGSTT